MNTPLFFLHLPKTAGTTLNSIFEANFGPEAIISAYDEAGLAAVENLDADALARLKLIQGHIFIRDFSQLLHGPVGFRVLTFLRDPVERLVSEYHFLKTWPEQHLYRPLNDNNVSLREYVTSDEPLYRWRGKNLMTHLLAGIGGGPEEKLERAKRHLAGGFVFFGLCERFDESLLMLQQHAGLKNLLYERRNVQKSRPKADDLDAETLDIIREHNQLDLALYAFAQAEFERRVADHGPGFVRQFKAFQRLQRAYQKIADKMREGEDGPILAGK